MREKLEKTTPVDNEIRCIEVLVPKSFLTGGAHNLYWTLTVYSLENSPVKKDIMQQSFLFHFMLYDWKKTIKNLLDSQKVPYTVIRQFHPESVFGQYKQDHVQQQEDEHQGVREEDTATV